MEGVLNSLYAYDGVGNILNMTKDTNNVDSFVYDARSRLTQANYKVSGVTTTQNFTYDRYGNLTGVTGVNPRTLTTSTTTNRLSSGTYDARGNLTAYGSEAYTYDGLDRMTTYTTSGGLTWKYLYDGAGERDVKIPPPSGDWTYTFRDEGKKVATEYSGANQSRDNVFLGSLLVASFANSAVSGNGPVWAFYASDHLGTPRLITDISGAMVESRKYWPYGEDATTPGTSQRLRFASMERDTEASRYYDHARSHEFNLGRFVSPDILGGRPRNPQGWNRYAYAGSNPLKYVDRTGLDFVLSGCATTDKDQCNQQKDLLRKTLGGAAFGYLKIGADGKVTIGKAAVSSFKEAAGSLSLARGMLALIGSKSTFSLITDNPAKAAQGGGGWTDILPGGGANMYLNERSFPQQRADVTETFETGFVHEMGHSIGSLFPSFRDKLSKQYGRTLPGIDDAYPVIFENQFRREMHLDWRSFVLTPYDYRDPGGNQNFDPFPPGFPY